MTVARLVATRYLDQISAVGGGRKQRGAVGARAGRFPANAPCSGDTQARPVASGCRGAREGAWVPTGSGTACLCRAGKIGPPCRGLARRRTEPTPPGSFIVGLTFGTAAKAGENSDWPRSSGSSKMSPRPAVSSFQTRFKSSQGLSLVTTPSVELNRGTKRRLTSGHGTAKLFRLFPEVKEPVIRTSNMTGCTVRGQFYEYPASLATASACRCTDAGMLWCWRSGVPLCAGCLVSGSYVPAGAAFTLRDGTGCSCTCRERMDPSCLAGPLLRVGGTQEHLGGRTQP
jgi:hypothetical protein